MTATSWAGCGGAVGEGGLDRLKKATPRTPTATTRATRPVAADHIPWTLSYSAAAVVAPSALHNDPGACARSIIIYPNPLAVSQPPALPSPLTHGNHFPRLGRGRHRAFAAPFLFSLLTVSAVSLKVVLGVLCFLFVFFARMSCAVRRFCTCCVALLCRCCCFVCMSCVVRRFRTCFVSLVCNYCFCVSCTGLSC